MENTKKCLDCGQDRPLDAFKLCYAGLPKPNRPDYADRNPAGMRQNRCKKCYSARERAQRKLEFLHAYGNKCACCGEDDHRFLSLDHVGNDGNKHREEFKCHQIYRVAKREGYPPKYQVLCYNCNFGKSTNGGICPHQSGITKERAWQMLRDKETYIGRDHVPLNSGIFTGGPDPRRMQLNRRVLKPCPYCSKEFGTNEMTRHKRSEHSAEMGTKKQDCLARGRARYGYTWSSEQAS
jgi:hypothetical protein